MSQYSIIASTTGFTAVRSGRGNTYWMAESATNVITRNMGPGGGSQWIIWNVVIPSVNPGETVNSLRLRGGHDYTVAEGGTGYSRVASLGVSIRRSVGAFVDASDGTAIGSRPGTGTGANVDALVAVSGFTSNELASGAMFVGMLAWADGGDSTFPYDQYRLGVLTWDFYTQGTTPTPPVGDPSIAFQQGAGNASPGKFRVIEQFASTKGIWVSNGLPARNFLSFEWTISGSGVTFAANGTNTLTAQKGWYYGPTNWDNHDTGPLNIAANAAPGNYTLTLVIRSGDGDGRFVYGSVQLTVRPRYIQLTEA